MARKRYTREFKIEAIQLAENSDKPMAQIARELGVHPNTLYKWRAAYAADREEAFPGHGKLKASDEQVRQLRRELERVRQERDILKKAVAFFASENS
jgi:transposase